MDMKNEVFAVSAYNVITWHDDRLEWDPEDRNDPIVISYVEKFSKVFRSIFIH